MADLGQVGGLSTVTTQLFSGVISGQVQDGSGPASHIVRAYHRTSGEFSGDARSDPVTGNYAIYLRIDKTGMFTVVELDDDAGIQYNDRVLGRITPL